MNDMFRCLYDAGNVACKLGLEFAERNGDIIVNAKEITRLNNGKQFDSNEVLTQVKRAINEKEIEYDKEFYLKTIEYITNIDLPSGTEHVIYYQFACMIIDRMMNFPEYEGTGFGKE